MLFTILAFYFSKPRLPIRANKTFLTLLVLQLLVMALDVVSSKVDENYALYSTATLYAANTAYFMLYIARAYWFYRSILHLLYAVEQPNERVEWLLSLPFGVSEAICATSFATGLVFSIGPEGYASGPWYKLLYLCSIFYVIVSVARVWRLRGRLRRRDLDCVLSYNFVLAAGNIVRYAFPQVLVMDTFCTMAITFIFLGFTNPDLYVAERGRAFNQRGFRLVLSEAVRNGDCHVFGVAVRNYHQQRGIMGDEQMDDALGAISAWLIDAFPANAPFYLNAGRFALIGDGSVDWDAIHAKVAKRFEEPWQTGNGPVGLGAVFVYFSESSGLTSADAIGNTLTLALETAQQDAGLGQGEQSDSLSIQEVSEQVRTMRALEHAIAHDSVEVFLQPVVAGSSRSLVGAEALARIRDEDGTLVSPALFIPLAERTGLIHELGEQVFDKTCAFIAANDLAAMGLRWVNVNLSPTQCVHESLPATFAQILERHQVSSSMIHLEITEQTMIDYSLISDQVQALQDMGFQFVLDDYGAGYSNLTRLTNYPFVNIKLDMAVVRSYCAEQDTLLPIVVRGFRDAGYTITAEGVETEEMAVLLAGIGTDFLQGYLFSRPVPMDEFATRYGGANANANANADANADVQIA